MKFINWIIILFSLFFLNNCAENTIYSGKIINDEKFNYLHIQHKNQLINDLGEPNYVDPIENKYFYFTEKRKVKNLFDTKIENRTILVFKFNDDDSIKSVEEFNLNDEKEISYSKDKIQNNLIKKGLIEKWFGGIGKSHLPNTSN